MNDTLLFEGVFCFIAKVRNCMPTDRRLTKMNAVARTRQQGILVLEDIYDPHNAIAVFRSCDAFGIQQIYIIFDEQAPFDPEIIGKATSSSANKWLDFKFFDSAQACIDELHQDGYEVIGTVLSDSVESLYEADLTNPKIALMMGNENRGLSEKAIALADRHLIIPMSGMVQSLNLSVSAAICLFELSRQRHAHGIEEFLLSAETQEALLADFLER